MGLGETFRRTKKRLKGTLSDACIDKDEVVISTVLDLKQKTVLGCTVVRCKHGVFTRKMSRFLGQFNSIYRRFMLTDSCCHSLYSSEYMCGV